MAFSAYLAYILAEPLTASAEQKQMAYNDYRNSIKDAVIANAIENPPESLADQTWILARL
jgi:flagellar motor component MotA